MSGHPSANNGFLGAHATLLHESHARMTGRPLLAGELMFNADFIVLSCDNGSDPLFNYANRKALALFIVDWETLTAMPARKSAEPDNQSSRAALMRQVQDQGYIDDYSGVRVSSTGQRFVIERATVWNVLDATGHLHGQAATFHDWHYL